MASSVWATPRIVETCRATMGAALPAVDLGTGRTATAIAAGWYHTCAILDNGAVKCWGHNCVGQLGLGDTDRRAATRAGEMGDALAASTSAPAAPPSRSTPARTTPARSSTTAP